jgi:YVTN family beta-propeller protein
MEFLMTMKRYLVLFKLVLITCTFNLKAQTLAEIESRRVSLPNGWHLTPVGKMLPLGDLPLNIAVSPSKRLGAVTNSGQSVHTLQLVDVRKGSILDSAVIGKAWLGLAFSGNGKYLYASGGHDNFIISYSLDNRKLSAEDTIVIGKPWPELISVAGLTIDDVKKRLYVVTKESNSLYVADLVSKKVISQHPLGGEGYTCILSPDRKTLYSSCWGCNKIIVFDTEQLKITGSIPVGDNPNDLCITRNGEYLYVANASDDNVMVIDTWQKKVIEILGTALYPGAPGGSTPNSVALSKDDKTLFIANADNNCLAVFDINVPGSGKSKGFIPTGWYPTSVRVAKSKILVSNGKGISSLANPYGPNPVRRKPGIIMGKDGSEIRMKVQNIAGLFRGTMNILSIPDEEQIGIYSKAVYNNTPYNKDNELISDAEQGNPIPQKVGDKSPIKYVFYVIKENRTYDQVLGDMPEGNGDPDLVLFGENITPNHHALAREFVLLDNFYCDGEVSADGHNWTMGAYAPDYMEKNWPTFYGGKGGTYPGEGVREMSNNKIYLWDICKRKGISYRSYGEFVYSAKPRVPVLDNHFCPYFQNSQMIRDTVRFNWWKRDFDSLYAINAVPQFSTLRFINDHTLGLRLGAPTPFASVADNDLATGMFVDYLSHHPVWEESLIIIVEDDAQDGPDHVDAHRSVALIAGGYVKKGFIDHTAYSTSSLLRTMELILGLPPMTQYDASATPLWRCLDNTPDHPPFEARSCLVNLDDKNIGENIWQKKSEMFDFNEADRINDAEFNEVIWKAVKGIESPCPPPVHAAFFKPNDGISAEDED